MSWIARTPCVFCAVSAVITDAPYTPSAENVFKSAWMPAPPLESEPAMVRRSRSCAPPLRQRCIDDFAQPLRRRLRVHRK